MFKLIQCIFAALVAYVSAGLIPIDDGIGLGGIPLGGIGLGGIGLGGLALASPKVIAAPSIAIKAGATSYQNSNLLALHPTPVVTKAIAAPIVTKVATPTVSLVGLDGHLGLGGGLGLGSVGLGGLGLGKLI
ncbi:zinc finger protein chinmo-like [Euwallacea similis]|uniref:zinc finger protein chinmo-like n=1 Tax=Euwallacea similis TaxID=1736056 RepID=UPI00344CB965